MREPLPLLLLAGLATGLHVVLVGLPGQAKTLLARRVGEALAGQRFKILSAATTSFDEIRGYIKPASLDSGRVEVVPGPWSVYDDRLLFVDELSRAALHAQSRWLQLIHERLVDGMPTQLEWVIGAMNPPSVEGTFPLGTATADRFHLALWLDGFEALPAAEREAIAALAEPSAASLNEAQAALVTWLDAVAARAAELEQDAELRERLAHLAVAALEGWHEAKPTWKPQGRRAVALRQVLTVVRAALEVERGPAEAERIFPRMLDALLSCGVSHIARIADHDEDEVRRAHESAFRAVTAAWQRYVQAASPEAKRAEALLAALSAPTANEATWAKHEAELAELAQGELVEPRLPVTLSRRVLEMHRLSAVRNQETVAAK